MNENFSKRQLLVIPGCLFAFIYKNFAKNFGNHRKDYNFATPKSIVEDFGAFKTV